MSNENSVEWIIKQLIFKTEFENLPNQYVLMSDKDISSIIEQAKAMHKEEIDNKVIYFAEWLTKKHTLELMTLYNQFEETYGGNNEQQ